MKILITGRSGSGKTTLLPALEKCGFKTYNTDDIDGVCRLEYKATNQPVDWPEGFIDWKKYGWRWQSEPLRYLLDSAANVAIAAVMDNQKEFYDWFNLRFVVTVDSETIARHWQSSSDHHKHMDPENLKRAVAMHDEKQQHFIDDGCIPIVGDRPIDLMAQDIMEIIHDHGGLDN